MQSRVRLWRELLISVVIVVLALLIFFNRQYLLDQILLWQYKPTNEISAIASDLTLTQEGTRYFYVSRPELLNKEDFNRYCLSKTEHSIILGCYVSQRIYVYEVNDERLPDVEEVTAAHEMLHAAYDRLPKSEREKIDVLVQATVDNLTDERLLRLVSLYRESEPGQLLNEMHSILGTEAHDLPEELEQHYGRYFADRAKVVAMSERYDKVFENLKTQQEKLIESINKLASQINLRNEQFNTAVSDFQAAVNSFNARAESGGFVSEAEYNQERAALINRQTELNQERNAINVLITKLKTQQEELKDLVFEAESLSQSINSHAPQQVPGLN